MHDPDMRLAASAPRRLGAVAAVACLGLLTLTLALATPALAAGWRAALGGGGLAALWFAAALWRSSGQALRLTARGLMAEPGELIAPIERITSVERGLFAVKPSGGFVLTLDRRAPAGWAPGMWWRIGRRVGVGGMVHPGRARAMADLIAAELARRAG